MSWQYRKNKTKKKLLTRMKKRAILRMTR